MQVLNFNKYYLSTVSNKDEEKELGEAEEEERRRESKEDINEPSDVSTIKINRHEKMGAFKSKSLWQPTATDGCG